MPYFKTDGLQFTAHLMIPKTQHLHPLTGKELIAFFIPRPLVRKAVSTPIQLHCQTSGHAEKIQKICAAGILSAKLEISKASVAQETPETLLGIGRLPAKMTGKVTSFNGARPAGTPHPNPLPSEGRGNRMVASGFGFGGVMLHQVCKFT